MVASTKTTRPLTPGSTGWCTDDLKDPEIRRQWDEQRVEMVHGVIAQMPAAAAFFDHSSVVDRLFNFLRTHFEGMGVEAEFGEDVDFKLSETVMYRADGIMLLPDDLKHQLEAQRKIGEPTDSVRSILIAPTLVVESVSKGHESHDYVVKMDDYARFGAPNYWIVSQAEKSLACYRLEDGEYVLDASGKTPKVINPSAFPGLSIPLKKVFR